jgi:membrane protein involved in colicin uptake
MPTTKKAAPAKRTAKKAAPAKRTAKKAAPAKRTDDGFDRLRHDPGGTKVDDGGRPVVDDGGRPLTLDSPSADQVERNA